MNISEFSKDVFFAPLMAFLIPIMWELAKIPIFYIKELKMKTLSILKVDLKLNTELTKLENIKFKCLLVRYWTDNYIKDMASDSEKYDGRLRNNLIDWVILNNQLNYKIPLHNRIWTQFKCFLETKTKEEAEQIMKDKDKYETIYDLSLASDLSKNRIFFLLKNYWTTETIDWFKNNMIFPI